MAKSGLSDEIKSSIKEMSIDGVVPKDVAAALGIAVSTVHHYKDLMRKDGVEFPELRGKRASKQQDVVLASDRVIPGIIVNGTRINITGSPVRINIGPDKVEVEY